jgi:hypothetical protein
MSKMDKYPVVLCTETEHGWKFWCPFCKRYHEHGKGAGHRVAHCTEKDDFEYGGFPHGYILKLDTRK